MILLFKFMIHVLVWSVSNTVTNDMLSCLAENICLIFTILLCCCLFNACVPLNKLPFDSMLHCVFYMIRKTVQSRFVSFVTIDKIKSAFDTLLDSEIVQSNIFQNISAYI